MKNNKKNERQELKTRRLTKLCNRGHQICNAFGEKIVSESENLRLENGSDYYYLNDNLDRIVGVIVPRFEEDEIWYGVNVEFSDRPVFLESRGKWVKDSTEYNFYNIDCRKYV